MNRDKKIRSFGSSSAELIPYEQYSSYEWTSDIRGKNVDVIVLDTEIDIMHYEVRDNIQLVDWQYLYDNPECTWDEWRSNDITREELNNVVKGLFQEILDEWYENGITRQEFQNFKFREEYMTRLIKRREALKYGPYLCLSGDNHGTATSSNIVGKTCGIATEAQLFFILGQTALGGSDIEKAYNAPDIRRYMLLPKLFQECKQRSNIKRPTVKSMSMSFNGSTKEVFTWLTDDGYPDTNPIIEGAISESFKIESGPLGGKIEVTIPWEVETFCKKMKFKTGTNIQNFIYSGSYDNTEENFKKIRAENYALNYVEENWNLMVARGYRNNLNLGDNNNSPRYHVQSLKITPDQQIERDNYDAYWNAGGICVRSAGNDSFTRHTHEHMESQVEEHKRNMPGGSITARMWETGSVINLYPRHATSSIIPSDGDIYAIQCTAPLSYLKSSEHTTNSDISSINPLSGSLKSLNDLNISFPFVWRLRPIFSNTDINVEWGSSGKRWNDYIINFKDTDDLRVLGFTTSSANFYTCDLDIIRNDSDFIANNISIVTGSREEGTLPSLKNSSIDLSHIPTAGSLEDERNVRGGEQVSNKISLIDYAFNNAYNIQLYGDVYQEFLHPNDTRHLSLHQFMFSYRSAHRDGIGISNEQTVPSGFLIGYLLEPYDNNDNLIKNIPLAKLNKLDNSAHLAFNTSSESDNSEFVLYDELSDTSRFNRSINVITSSIGEGLVFDGSTPVNSNVGITYTALYFSGSLNTAGEINQVSGSGGVTGSVHYIFNEDTEDVYTSYKNVLPDSFITDDIELTEYDIYVASQSTDINNRLLLIKESPRIGRGLKTSTIAYSPIKLSGYTTQQDADDRGIIAGSTALHPMIDMTMPHHVSQSYQFPPTVLTSSFVTNEKFFFIPSSSQNIDNEQNFDITDRLTDHTNRGTRVDIFAPGQAVLVAIPNALDDRSPGVTLLDYFDSGSVYSKNIFAFASCSYENMNNSQGNRITDLGFMTGSELVVGGLPIRESIVTNVFEDAALSREHYYYDNTGRVNSYAYVRGTSFACPLTAGVVALWLDLYPNLTPLQVKQILRETSNKGALQDPSFYRSNTNIKNALDFDKWIYGIQMPLEFPREIRFNPRVFVSSSYTTDLPLRKRIFDGVDPITGVSIDEKENIRSLNHYLYTRTDYSNPSALRKSFNGVLHWPYARTNRSEITTPIENILFSGSMSFES